MKKMSNLVAEIDALILKVKACPIKATVVASSKTTQAAPPAPEQNAGGDTIASAGNALRAIKKAGKKKGDAEFDAALAKLLALKKAQSSAPKAPAPKAQEEEKASAPEPKAAAPKAAAGATTGSWLDCDTCKEGQLVEVCSTWQEIRKAWTECELGGIDDADLMTYVGHVGKVMEVEDDDDTIQIRWENLDENWIPIRCCKSTTKALSSPPPVAHVLAEHEKTLVPTPGLTQVEGDYLDIDSVKEGMKVQVTEKLKHLIKQWAVAELGNLDDPTLNSYLLQTGKIAEVEEDDDTVQLEWENLDTMWIPVNCCRAAPNSDMSSPPPVSCLNNPDAEPEEDAKPFFRKRDYAMSGESYLTEETVKAKQHYMVTLDRGYMGQAAEDADIEVNAEAICGYVGKCTKIDGKTAEITFNNKKTATVPIAALHKPNKKKKKKGSPDL